MAGTRIPGPFGSGGINDSIDDGTLTRSRSPRPGSLLGVDDGSLRHQPPRHITLPRAGVSNAQLAPTLQLGQRGPEVEQLQRLLNARLRPSPSLPVDGNFNAAVQQQVQRLQQSQGLQSSGRVDAATWFALLKGDPSSGKDAANGSVAEWTLQQKFTAALQFTLPKLPMSLHHEFATIINPINIRIMAGTLVVWAGSHAFGLGEIIDIVFLLAGVVFLGFAAKDVAGHVSDFIKLTCAAKTERDLNAAASHLAQVIAIIGVAAFAVLLTKCARRISNARAAPSPRPTPVVKEPAPKIARRRTAVESGESLEQGSTKPTNKSLAFEPKRTISAEEANLGFDKPPYKSGSQITEATLLNDTKFARLYDGNNSGQLGRWMMPENEVRGLTPAQIQEKFALPQAPTNICEVNVPAGTTVRFGEAGPISGWGRGGGMQFQLMDRIPASSYINPRSFP